LTLISQISLKDKKLLNICVNQRNLRLKSIIAIKRAKPYDFALLFHIGLFAVNQDIFS